MPLLASTPREETLLTAADVISCVAITDNFGTAATNARTLYGPLYVLPSNGLYTTQGLALLGADGKPLMQLRVNGMIELRGVLLSTYGDPISYSANGVYWKNSDNLYTHHLDMNGNLLCIAPVVESLSDITLEKAAGDFDAAQGLVRVFPPCARTVFHSSNASYPIMQVVNADEDCMIKFNHSGVIETRGVVVPAAGDAPQTVYRSFVF